MNQQPIEKQFNSPDGTIELHHIFYTIQGEGPYAGERAAFIRLAGCNLQCPGCDTDYTNERHLTTPIDVVYELLDIYPKGALVVISGGEPTRQTIGPLCAELVRAGYKVQIESNGVRSPDEQACSLILNGHVMLVLSPKTKKINDRAARLATAFKYVLRHGDIDPEDGLPLRALEHKASPRVARPPEGWTGIIYVNPYDETADPSKNELHIKETIQSCMKHGYRMGIQLHKVIGLE